jgi:hypothetical protein
VKALGELCEWSFGFDIEQATPGMLDGKSVRFLNKTRVFEVSPVLQGAGIGTRTVDMKAAIVDCPKCAAIEDEAAKEAAKEGCENCGCMPDSCVCAKAVTALLLDYESTRARLLGVEIN